MAKSKSSQQENLASSKTGIDMTAGLGFTNDVKIGSPAKKKPEVSPAVDTLAVDKKAVETQANLSQVKTEPRPKNLSSSHVSKKLKRPSGLLTDDSTVKISAIISVLAKENLEKYAKLYGYKKLSPFINELFENLDAYMED